MSSKNRSAIPRPGGTTKHGDGAHSSGNAAVSARKLRKSSSSDPEAEYTTSADGARVKVSKPLKMQGPFRPSIVGRMAKTGDWMLSKNKTRHRSERADEQTNIPRRNSNEETGRGSKTSVKVKNRSPTDRKPLINATNTLHPETQETHNEKTKIVMYKKPTAAKESMYDLKKENRALKEKVETLTGDIASCKQTLEKCHIDPVTLEPLKFNEEQISHEKTATMHQVQESKKAMENILEHNTEMIESLKDLLKGLT